MMKTKMIFTIALSTLMGAGILSAQYISDVSYPEKQNTPAIDSTTKFANRITAADIKKHMLVLASDEFQGRETGTEGNALAANYIARHFKSLGLPAIGDSSDYFQSVAFTWVSWDNIEIQVKDDRYRHLWDFVAYNTENNNLPEFKTDEVIFLGYGIDDFNYSDYKEADVEGKVILIYKGEPKQEDGTYWVSGNKNPSEWSSNIQMKLEAAYRKKVKAVLIIEDQLKEKVAEDRRLLLGPRVLLGEPDMSDIPMANACYISTNVARAIIGKKFKKLVKLRDRINENGENRSLRLKTDLTLKMEKKSRSLEGVNILGFIEGTHPFAKNEIVVVSAHYDHIGAKGKDINNGADDNASGTTTVMEIADALARARKEGMGPKRSVLCLLVTGEEKGLLGSEYYAQHPVFPLENTIVNVNIDMVGRVDENYMDKAPYIYVIGSDRLSRDLHDVNEKINNKYQGLILDYKYNDEADPNRFYYRSDHYNFAKNGIPAIFFFNGVHEDYHRPTDTVEKIDFELMETRARHIFQLVWDLSNSEKRIELNETP